MQTIEFRETQKGRVHRIYTFRIGRQSFARYPFDLSSLTARRSASLIALVTFDVFIELLLIVFIIDLLN